MHKWPGSLGNKGTPGAAFEVQEMGEHGTGSLEPGIASGDVFWIGYPAPFLEYFYAANPDKMPGGVQVCCAHAQHRTHARSTTPPSSSG